MSEAVMTTRRQADGTMVADVRGSLDASTIDGFRTAFLATLHGERPRLLIVDLTFVTFMDSIGMGMLVSAHESAREQGTRLTLRNPSEFVHRQLRVTGLTDLFSLPATPNPQSFRF
ncbi:STAS domain-containing protein [Actinoplanes sp. G11-F43]|uniref:STAS domain-containing protein n=1 Tax=Actinoplanes sp. G11-F43 TaxID=3424130 RepID=UPI003D32594F